MITSDPTDFFGFQMQIAVSLCTGNNSTIKLNLQKNNFYLKKIVCFYFLQVVITLDPAFMKPGEYETFFSYLLNDNLHIDVWDSSSHMFIGSAAVELKVS